MEWISEKDTAEILGVTRQRLRQLRQGYSRKTIKGKLYKINAKFPAEVWRYTNRIEYDKNFILEFKKRKENEE